MQMQTMLRLRAPIIFEASPQISARRIAARAARLAPPIYPGQLEGRPYVRGRPYASHLLRTSGSRPPLRQAPPRASYGQYDEAPKDATDLDFYALLDVYTVLGDPETRTIYGALSG
eukprot:gene17116-23418_t